MRLLILGGTIFLGRHLTEAALARGHHVSLFNRGKHHSDLFPNVEKLRGDRDGDLRALQGQSWDTVIDTSGYIPRVVRASAELLADQVEHYTFISSVSVYADFKEPGINEESAAGVLEDQSVEQITVETYGPLKALCEQTVEAALPGRALHIRPGLIVGPHDPTDRFTYWPRRIARRGDVLAPGNPEAPVQFIDVRDLASWILQMVEAKQTGVYNATGPATPMSMRGLLEGCQEALNSDAQLVWLDEQFLLEAEVQPWIELPLWIPEGNGSSRGFQMIDCSKALTAGLSFRPLAATIRDTQAWDVAAATGEQDTTQKSGQGKSLSAEREAQLLHHWRERH